MRSILGERASEVRGEEGAVPDAESGSEDAGSAVEVAEGEKR
jgi:hypothetical protein